MNLSLTKKASFFILLLFTILLAPLTASSATEEVTDWLDEPINLSFQSEPLSMVLKQISKQTGISIAYDQNLANETVSGNYQGIKASDAITRLFRSKNKTIQVNKEKKVIIVKTFGAKSFIWAGTMQVSDTTSQIRLADLDKIFNQQYKEYKERIANDNEIIEDGITRGEIRAMQAQQYNLLKKKIANNDEVIADSEGMTRGTVRELHAQQYQNIKNSLNNDDEIIKSADGATNTTRGEIRTMHTHQYDTYTKRIADDNELISDGGEMNEGITRGEIRAMHVKQYEAYRERQKDRTRVVN